MSDQTHESGGFQVEASAAEAYEQYLVPAIFASWTERLIDRADIKEGDRVLDVATGTGIVARRAAPRVGDTGSVVGLDINDEMLAVAERVGADNRPPIEWRHGDAADLPFPDEQFDVVYCQQALQFFEDPTAALGEMRRVLAPDGRTVISVWRPLDYLPEIAEIADALESHFGEKAGKIIRSPYPVWDIDDLRTLARDAGFGEVSITIELGSERYPSIEELVRLGLSALPSAEQLADEATQEALIRDLREEFEKYIDDEGFIFPTEAYVITVHR